jgi:hypothetical protein
MRTKRILFICCFTTCLFYGQLSAQNMRFNSFGGGGGGAGLLMVMLPPVPGDAISSAPQPVTRTAAAVAYTIPRNLGSNILNLRNKMACPTMGSYNAAATNQKESPPVDVASFRHHL